MQNVAAKLHGCSLDLIRIWPKVMCDTNAENASNITASIKNLHALLEEFQLEVLRLEAATAGGEMSEERRRELEACEHADTMFRKWLPVIMLNEC